MYKLVVFDLDGVLVDSKDIHFTALNRAISEVAPGFEISIKDHLSKYDGLNTTKKLQMLSKEKNLPETAHDLVWRLKQSETIEIAKGKYQLPTSFSDNVRQFKRQIKEIQNGRN